MTCFSGINMKMDERRRQGKGEEEAPSSRLYYTIKGSEVKAKLFSAVAV